MAPGYLPVHDRDESRLLIARLRRALFTVAAGAFFWSLAVALTGGFSFQVSGWRLSSRHYRDALAIGLVLALLAIALTWRVGGWPTLRDESRRLANRLAAAAARAWRPASRLPAITPAVAIAVTAIALDIRQWAYARPLWFDEEAILLNVRDRSWSGLGGSLWLGQAAPFGWLVAERAALVTLGTGELAVRLLPLLFGLATIAAALWIGARWMGALGAAVLVLLCAFGPLVSHFVFEAKQYSADTFAAAWLPAVAVWATEGHDVERRTRRALVWWIAAAVGQMMANGALLVAPGCALFLGASILRRDGRRAAFVFALSGIVFLAALGLHDVVSLRATRQSRYLYEYWSNEIPPASMGIVERARWIADRLPALALDPAGTAWTAMLWVCAAAGLALGGRPALGLAFATAPLSAFLFAGFRVVPLYQRFVLWIVPALYVGLALLIDWGAGMVRDARRRGRWRPAFVAAPVLIVAGAVSLDIFARGRAEIPGRMPVPVHKHHFDDRAAVRWLMARVRPGDALVTTHLAWAAIWWYGGLSIAEPASHPADVAVLEVEHVGPGLECRDDHLRDDLKRYRRVVVYVGFDTPPGFDFLLLHRLDQLGAIEAFSEFSDRGRTAVFDLHVPDASELTLHDVSPKTTERAVPLEGCARLRPASRW
jgi:hypothetical protein